MKIVAFGNGTLLIFSTLTLLTVRLLSTYKTPLTRVGKMLGRCQFHNESGFSYGCLSKVVSSPIWKGMPVGFSHFPHPYSIVLHASSLGLDLVKLNAQSQVLSFAIDDTLRCSISWATHVEAYCQSPATQAFRQPTMHIWRPPVYVQTCLNVDASIDTISGLGTVSEVLRTKEGVWLQSFHKFIGISSPPIAELWGILTGLHFSWNFGIEAMQIQSDSYQAIKLVLDHNAGHTTLTVVRAIHSMYARRWYT
ncbi:hypothetical protein F3Y22_tig00110482pilonHSYRG00239 [Hibiscus syriacus]|uniref:RNase H type-1 domain-containing protein n=1 Tax=Hibiscus syriacus TaxID=106335 RepID=A0A6A3AI85_HIBSY|nr:hypothetical protein F3Y22_tig00110482pilonHSYRG00239 [Hibiscus syriacus]